jgi:hypothetical protein
LPDSAVPKHEIERHAVESRGLDLPGRFRAGLRRNDGMAGMLRGKRDQRALSCIIIDDQETERVSFTTVRPRLGICRHGNPFALIDPLDAPMVVR